MKDTIIDLIRHGEPVGGRRYRGHTIDDPLTEKGWMQMWHAVGDYHHWQQIISSPLLRCQAFAVALGNRHNISVAIEPRLREVGFGEWEGLSHDTVKKERIDEYRAFLKDPVHRRPEGAEVLGNFIQRVASAYEDVITHHHGKRCLIVTHAGVIRAIIARVVNADPVGLYRIKINNGGITRIRHTETGDMLECLNGQLTGE
ncbi:MAG: alpha-ribazole phosphatase family protein [Burkholderiales bacterium]|uniref:histidine phosphatase family protein n=1 Tax=Nitrosomonas sp. TaxID=42353 RepID=UPI001DC3E224|nr:alpha-ribazole phosphatase family protein [Nitrosomonas sp.]MCB1948004.1 alpha-ribazole phosphatase family protein [Nitrosomonas sp.]MCP5243867.1 alpha-ribazole phosphatase family protein [Burkholderiales bacterium]